MGFNYFIPLTKADEATHEVWGWCAVEEPDVQKEILDYDLSKPNFVAWSEKVYRDTGGKSKGNVRALHKGAMAAVGKVIHFEPVDEKKAFWVGAKIVDEEAWQKVIEGVYTGFSVGGRYGKRMPDALMKGYTRYEALPSEVSLVDVPAAPSARYELVKSGGEIELRKFAHELAKGESLQDAVDQIRGAFNKQFLSSVNAVSYDGWVIDVQTDQVIVDKGANGLFAYPYQRDETGAVFFGEPVAVERTFTLKKSAQVQAALAKLQAIITEMKESDNPDVKAYGEKIQAANDAEENLEAQEEGAEGEGENSGATDTSTPEGDAKTKPAAEEGGMPQGQGMSADAVKEIVISLLTELGLVQREGDAAQKADFSGELRKSFETYGETLGKFDATLNSLEEKVNSMDDLKKSFDGKTAAIVSDLAAVITGTESLNTRLEAMEKRGSMGPVLRELGSITPEQSANEQQAEALTKMASNTTDPMVKQSLMNEAARLRIKTSLSKPLQ